MAQTTHQTPYTPSSPPSHPLAADFIPTYLHTYPPTDTSDSNPIPNPNRPSTSAAAPASSGPNEPARPAVKISDDFYGTRRKVRVGVLGAGITALNFLHFAEERLRDVEVVVYEREADVGGVWLTSKYPGCRCDIPSIVYQFSWRRNIWSEMYAPAAENLAYLQRVARENGFYRFIKLRHEIVRAAWADEEAKWTLTVRDLGGGGGGEGVFEDKVDVFCEFNGPVSNPRITALPGIEDFKGEVVHPAYWTDETSVDGKRVALVGYGCSGVQIAPNIIDRVSKLYTWYRNKTYILPPPNQAFSAADGANFRYSDEQKALLSDPDVYLAYRKAVDEGFYKRYSYIINGSKMANAVQDNVIAYMREKLAGKPELLENIMPERFGIGCRRQTFSYGYLEAITNPKTMTFTKSPQRFTEKGLLDADGVEHELDMVIAATGYDQSHMPRFPKLVNGESMLEKWSELQSPPSYLAIGLQDMPNYFNPSSAYGPLPQGNYYESSEAFTKYITKVIEKMQIDHIVSIVPKNVAVNHFVRHANAWLQRTAVTGPCVAWYKGNASDKLPALWPGARSQFLKLMETPRFEDFDIRYENADDMFSFLGNGWTLEVDGDPAADKTWYMGRPDKEIDMSVIERLRGTDASVEKAAEKTAVAFGVNTI